VGGGGGIQAIRTARTRLILAALSLVSYGGALAYTVARGAEVKNLVAAIGAIGAALLVLVLWRRMDELLPWAVIPLGLAYAVTLLAHGSNSIDGGAPLVATALLLCTELAAWSLDERHGIAAERAVLAARASGLALLAGAGLAASALVLALSAAPVGGGLAWTALGAAAAVLVVGLAVRLARPSS
jgi:hypothetical protein